MVIFFNLLNISVYLISVYKANHPEGKILRFDFVENVAWELIKPQIEERSALTTEQ